MRLREFENGKAIRLIRNVAAGGTEGKRLATDDIEGIEREIECDEFGIAADVGAVGTDDIDMNGAWRWDAEKKIEIYRKQKIRAGLEKLLGKGKVTGQKIEAVYKHRMNKIHKILMKHKISKNKQD